MKDWEKEIIERNRSQYEELLDASKEDLAFYIIQLQEWLKDAEKKSSKHKPLFKDESRSVQFYHALSERNLINVNLNTWKKSVIDSPTITVEYDEENMTFTLEGVPSEIDFLGSKDLLFSLLQELWNRKEVYTWARSITKFFSIKGKTDRNPSQSKRQMKNLPKDDQILFDSIIAEMSH